MPDVLVPVNSPTRRAPYFATARDTACSNPSAAKSALRQTVIAAIEGGKVIVELGIQPLNLACPGRDGKLLEPARSKGAAPLP